MRIKLFSKMLLLAVLSGGVPSPGGALAADTEADALMEVSLERPERPEVAEGEVVAPVLFRESVVGGGNEIRAIENFKKGGQTYIRIEMARPLKGGLRHFSTITPPRIVLNIESSKNSIGREKVSFPEGSVLDATILRAGKRAGIVLALRRSTIYEVQTEGKFLTVVLGEQIPGSRVAKSRTVSGPQKGAPSNWSGIKVHSLKKVDFRQGPKGEGQVVLDFSDSAVGVDIRKEGRKIIVQLAETSVSDQLKKVLDVSDFPTPIKKITTRTKDENAQIIIEPDGVWDYSAHQVDRQLVVEVSKLEQDPTALVPGAQPGYHGEKLSMNFQNVDIRSLLQVIADFTGYNIVTSDSVTGNISLHLLEVPWDQALDIVLQTKGLDKRKNGSVIMIAPAVEFSEKEKKALEAKREFFDIAPVVTEVFQLNYQRGEAVVKLLGKEEGANRQRMLSKRGSVSVDERTNKLFVQDTPDRLEDIRKMIAQIDIPVRQVLIEARIVEASDDFNRNLGVRLGFNDQRSTVYRTVAVLDPVTNSPVPFNVPVYGAGEQLLGGLHGTVAGSLGGAMDLSSQNGSGLSDLSGRGLGKVIDAANINFVNLPASGLGGVSPASIGMSLFGPSLTRFINLEISALESDNKAKTISSPRILTADQTKAVIEQGTEVPYQAATSSGATSVEFKKAVMKLEVTPQITPEGGIILNVEVSRDSVGTPLPGGIPINTRRVQTQVLVENGGTVVIGGIYEQNENKGVTKVPFFGDLPFIGSLFSSQTKVDNRKELLVFLTPRTLSDKISRSGS